MDIVSSNHVVVRRVMRCARSSGIDEGLQDNVAALLVQSLLHAWNIAPGASCRELLLDQELRARGQRVLMGKTAALPRLSTLSARLARQKPCRPVDGSLAGRLTERLDGKAAHVRFRVWKKWLKPLHTERGHGL